MHDLDSKINQISGQNNYMEQLAKITGDLFTIDRNKYKEVITKCGKCDFNLKILATRFLASKDLDSSTNKLFTDFLETREAFDIANKTFVMKVKKSKKASKAPKEREVIDTKHIPSEVFKSEWFKLVRQIEKLCRKYLKLVFETVEDVEKKTAEDFKKAFTSVPELDSVSYFGGIHVQEDDSKLFMNIVNSFKCSRIIINEFLNPMYDVRKTIEKNRHIIDKAFKSAPMQQLQAETGNQISSSDDVITILESFIIAKYRATISGNNKYYVKLFTSIIDPSSSAEMEGAKFLDIMERLNFEELGKNNKAYKFAVGAKEIINSIVTNQSLDSEDIISKVQNIFDGDDKAAEVTEESKQFDDLL